MKRSCCPKCHYPNTTCVCKYVSSPIANNTKVIVLQHPSEVTVAKNTVRLLTLQLSNIDVFIGEDAADFESARQLIENSDSALLYPNEQAVSVQQLSCQSKKIDTLVVIDGTWKKAHKILATNPWLMKLPSVTFAKLPHNQYRIRKAEQENSLSSLEAVALFLNEYEHKDQQPLLNLLNGMIAEQTKFMPEHVKTRYE
ncbi:tRNA-uridine aminocarboxypropyltransferase [Pseudoalteromonas sp. S16_S37]|uniref:tRNA-uridine aminocarboxypropyltransferase n=1 Tax=Pseudoalteromonas sp. S16_S37 TaxID=2720228 RepID=UPI0016817B3C|nr:tRNA-uridine aminocarboxypropyltransferase [Pseudoalteromonas sp. S16_S37]MBD1583529.1 DTW domain-containing protein [Pseudoalteromonas sp. S16_S37]